uniref:Ovule protein n=1 Tax=Caenorhabditis tropicalis TaxID=1561998 RepID=A0A1I7TLW0_9PELO
MNYQQERINGSQCKDKLLLLKFLKTVKKMKHNKEIVMVEMHKMSHHLQRRHPFPCSHVNALCINRCRTPFEAVVITR